MPSLYDVAAVGNAIVDVIAPASEDFLRAEGLTRGGMTLIDEATADALYGKMAAGIEASGGSAANTAAGVASLGGRAAYMGKVADDQLGAVFVHDMTAIGVHFRGAPLAGGPATARCLSNVTPDGERTMCTFLGAAVELRDSDIDQEAVEGAEILYLEGYLFDPPEARRAFARAAGLARGAGRSIALSLSDAFVVDRHREALIGFIRGQVDIVFANEAELISLFGAASLEEAVKAAWDLADTVVVTLGASGSMILNNGASVAVEPCPVAKVVDTTGAGDQYAAGFLHGLATGRPLAECGHLASMAAAEVIAHYGPRPQASLRELAAAQGL